MSNWGVIGVAKISVYTTCLGVIDCDIVCLYQEQASAFSILVANILQRWVISLDHVFDAIHIHIVAEPSFLAHITCERLREMPMDFD